ncbi:hypothetical protein GH808_03730 [Acetobacterium fimetarium]|uniref:Uncharacterized protein n=1 Tax=Acetobacterium fimetarium TaxID=52691 RepID=A0ABR6WSJ7_9FIRM|nr:hypothetical protein [Acetobacterium fimetarium]MBC3803546.1 hypothetical protein [Acetobacterium fimetarium]
MDQIIKKVAALGVPGLVFMVAIDLTGLAGAAALTTALAALGPGGIVGGVMTLCVLGVIADGIAEYEFDEIAKDVIRELYCKGESKESIKVKVSKYPISSKMKNNLYEVADKFA